MKKILLLAALALALPTAMFAGSSVDYSNSDGTLSGSSSGLGLSGSVLIAVHGLNGGGVITGPNLSSLRFSKGALASGALQNDGTFEGGEWFTIARNGMNGVPSGTLLAGTFDGPVTWTAMVPEPSSLSLLGAGLICLAGVVRRKLRG